MPLASFPEGDYRLEIKVTDKIANKTLTRDVNFTVSRVVERTLVERSAPPESAHEKHVQNDGVGGRRRSDAPLLSASGCAARQGVAAARPITHIASLPPGRSTASSGREGAPVAGAMVSALGATTAFAVTDRSGRFELRTLSPGPYLVRAHLSGFVASRGADRRGPAERARVFVDRAAARADAGHLLAVSGAAAGIGAGADAPDAGAGRASTGTRRHDAERASTTITARPRGGCVTRAAAILKDVDAVPTICSPTTDADGSFGAASFGRAVGSPARLATSFFADTPFSGQVNLLTTGSFDTPQQLFSADNFARGIAYLALGAPVGEHADWTVRGALTQADISSWIVAGAYTTRAPARHRYDVGLSYSTQRYDGGNFAALRDVTDGSRNAGAVYGFDTFAITPALDADLRRPLRALRLSRRTAACSARASS